MDIEEFLRQLQSNMDEGALSRLYRAASVSQEEVLRKMRELGLEVYSIAEIPRFSPEQLDPIADRVIAENARLGGLTGAGFGSGGFFSIAPELAWLFVDVIRLAQRLSLVYGFEFDSHRGRLDLWSTMGNALGVDVEVDGMEPELTAGLPIIVGRGQFRDPVVLKLAQRIFLKVAMRTSVRLIRLVPLLGAGLGGVTNYAWLSWLGHRLKENLRGRHALRIMNLADPSVSEAIAFTIEEQRG